MVKKLVFHLGDIKTGSTSIQNVLHKELWQSDKLDLCYPVGRNHVGLAGTLLKNQKVKHSRRRFTPYIKSLSESDADVGVLSTEIFQQVDPELFKVMIERFFPEHRESVRIICYVRPHAERLVSLYAQHVKRGSFSGDLEAFHQQQLDDKATFYVDRFSKWRAVFGDQFELRPMIRKYLYKQCVVHDFLEYSLESQDFSLIQPVDKNTSMSIKELSIVREISQSITHTRESSGIQQGLGLNFAKILDENPEQTQQKFAMHESLLETVISDFSEDAAKLDDLLFEGSPMQDALAAYKTKTVKEPQSIKLDDQFDPEQARHIRALCDLINEITGFQPKAVGLRLRRLRSGPAEVDN